MNSSRTIIIAGAGIAGLTTALALSAQRHRIIILEQASELDEIGAGLQLSPNASRVLLALGLGEALKDVIVAPTALAVHSARNGRQLVSMPLAPTIAMRYGAPYWIAHRADLQAALLAAVRERTNIALEVGAKVEDYASHSYGLTVQIRRGIETYEERAAALIGADGLWSTLRQRVGNHGQPQFRRRAAWRALVDPGEAPERARERLVRLWLGHNAHLVHYPVRGGRAINIVAIARDTQEETGWSNEGSRSDLLALFAQWNWCGEARELMKIPRNWTTWRLYDLPPLRQWGQGAVTLVGDAAHPMLPFLAQGAAMAIEDAAVLAVCVAASPNDLAAAFRSYEHQRRARATQVQSAARRTGDIYHLTGVGALARNVGMRLLGSAGLMRRHGWIYGWRPPELTESPPLRNEVAAPPAERAGRITAAGPDAAS